MSFIRKIGAVPLLAAGIGLGLAVTALAGSSSVQTAADRPNSVTMVAGTGSFATKSSSAWEDLPGSQTAVTIPTNSNAYFLARFSAQSVCYGPGGFCPVRVMLSKDGQTWEEIGIDITQYPNVYGAATPSQATFAFDSTNGGRNTGVEAASHAFEQHSRGFVNGTYLVKVQVGVNTPGDVFSLNAWHLTVESECYIGNC